MHRCEKAGLSHSSLVSKVCCVGSRGFARVGEHVLVDPFIDNWRVAGAKVAVQVYDKVDFRTHLLWETGRFEEAWAQWTQSMVSWMERASDSNARGA